MVLHQPLDLVFRGERTYIQGSLLLSEAIEKLKDDLRRDDRAGDANISIRRCLFRKITTRACAVCSDIAQIPAIDVVAELTVDCSGQEKRAVIHEIASAQGDVPRIPDSPSVLRECDHTGLYSGNATYCTDPNLDGLLRAIIEWTKYLHNASTPTAKDVWFVGMNSSGLPTSQALFSSTGRIIVKNEAARLNAGRIMTSSNVRVLPDQRPPFELTLLFAFKP